MQFINSQFAHPRGVMGRIAGTIMAYENRERNRWAISLLNLQPTDHVLEIGFGPGWAIQQMAHIVTSGLVAGVDTSDAMVQQASKRNAAEIQLGRVVLRQGSAVCVPFDTNTFDKVLAVNSLHIWSDPDAGLRDSWRVLRHGGRAVIAVQPVWDNSAETERRLHADLIARLTQAGFVQVRVETQRLKPAVVAAIGLKEPVNPLS